MTLRITKFLNHSTTQLQIQFSAELDPKIGIANVFVNSPTLNVRSLDVLAIIINGSTVTVETSPQVPYALYYVLFVSTASRALGSIDGDSLIEDGFNNRIDFLGLENVNDIRDSLFDFIAPTYDFEDDSIVRKHVADISQQLLRGRTDIREAGSANYISIDVVDEVITRGFSNADRLSHEGVYEIVRVAQTPTGAINFATIDLDDSRSTALLGNQSSRANPNITSIQADPFSLQSVAVVKEIVSNVETIKNKFDELLVTVSHNNVIQLNSVVLNKEDGSSFIYDIPKYGYALTNNRYDTKSGHSLLDLSTNQIKLSEIAVIDDEFAIPSGLDEIVISYLYIDRGILADDVSSPPSVTQVRQTVRELIGSFLTTFFLKHFPIVTSSDGVPNIGGVLFLDPNPSSGQPFTTTHPAFTNELAFSASKLPGGPGDYAVNYSTGQVFVFGAVVADGTGAGPPVASYYYRNIFIPGLDYIFDPATNEVVANPLRSLAGQEVKISYSYERTFAAGDDYLPLAHNEIINERVGNRLVSTFRIATLNSPITAVSEIFNETTGETYSATRFDDNYITLAGRKAPVVKESVLEPVNFNRVFNERLLVSVDISDNSVVKVVRLDLQNKTIVSSTGQTLGANFNTSVSFSLTNIFQREFYYDSILMSVSQNISKLTIAGDYIIDYIGGIVYIMLGSSVADFGEVSYVYGNIDTAFKNVLAPSDTFYSISNNSAPVVRAEVAEFTATDISVTNLIAPERFLNGITSKPILLGSQLDGVAGQHIAGSNIFVALDGRFEASQADGNHILRIVGDSDRAITGFISLTSVLVDTPFTTTDRSVSWYLIDFNFNDGDGYNAVTTYNISYIRAIYEIEALQTDSAASLVNLWDSSIDTFDSNLITFNNSIARNMSPGTAIIIDYDVGKLFTNYSYVADNLLVSYDFGDNSIDWSISDVLKPGDKYYASYKFGALREALVTNFGSLTQIPELASIPQDFSRETYRDALTGTLQSFVTGPTVSAFKKIVSSITHIEPQITELTFNEWTLNRDNLYLKDGQFNGIEKYADARFDRGLVIDDETTLFFPSESYISLKEGTFETWLSPQWRGLDNDSILTFSLYADGYLIEDGYNGTLLDLNNIFIGSSAFNPTSNPFAVSRFDAIPSSVLGKPFMFGTERGFYIWFDEDLNEWALRTLGDPVEGIVFSGKILTTGQFFNVKDGYNSQLSISINETNDFFTSTANYINFQTNANAQDVVDLDGYVGLDDGYDGYISADGYDGYLYEDGINFNSDDLHYLWDTGPSLVQNRLSVFKDGSGYLNFRAIDAGASGHSRTFIVSSNIHEWNGGELHHVATSWRFNSPDAIDEMHLFIDGQEVNNLFKFGGRPISTDTSLFRSEADEILTTSASKNIIGSNDGITVIGTTFKSASSDFIASGITTGDVFVILDPTIDSTISRTVASVIDSNTLIVNTPFILALTNISFSINQLSFTTSTLLDTDHFAVVDTDGYGLSHEMNGPTSVDPDYTISKNGHDDIITFNKNVSLGDILSINTLGLTRGRSREVLFDYRSDNILSTNFVPPSNLADVDIYKIIIKSSAIVADGYIQPPDGYWSPDGLTYDGYFDGLCQPSNIIKGKQIRVTLNGTNNINFSGINHVIIHGTTFAGPTSETISFTTYGSLVTTNFFTNFTFIIASFTGINSLLAFGALEIRENISLTREENNGDYAEVSEYNNGAFSLLTFGSGGLPFNLESCYYMIDYPTRLSIPITEKGRLYLGSDINGANQLDGTLDELVFLNEMLSDIRAGETPSSSIRTVTTDYTSIFPSIVTPQTLMLMHFDGNFKNEDDLFATYDSILTSSRSVNENFGDAAIFYDNDPLIIDNGSAVFVNDHGTIEFWISPFIDTYNDIDIPRYYVDVTTLVKDEVLSSNKTTVILPKQARQIRSVRLISDNGTDLNFFSGGFLDQDGHTVHLGVNLPGQMTTVSIVYVPLDSVGDRISIYKDGYDLLNFEILASQQLFQISYPIAWRRNTWHRVMATWDLNNITNNDRIRLFVDGIEGGTILYGMPGLIYGMGTLYGSAAVGSLSADFLTTNIDLLDTFAQIIVGNNFEHSGPSRSRMDNIRFSKTTRIPSTVAGISMDLNYSANLNTVLPVVQDSFTSALFDFDRDPQNTGFLSNLLHEATPLFTFDVDVIDAFKRATNPTVQKLISDVIERLKPAHTSAHVTFVE